MKGDKRVPGCHLSFIASAGWRHVPVVDLLQQHVSPPAACSGAHRGEEGDLCSCRSRLLHLPVSERIPLCFL